jgi:hypothetical protein
MFDTAKKERANFSLKGELTIGVITNKGKGHSKSVQYEYVINDKHMRGIDPRYDLDPNGSDIFENKVRSKLGSRFLVVYDAEDPQKSIIRLDYPIKDSADFKRYVQEFEEMRKQKK